MSNINQPNETIRQSLDLLTQRAFREQGRFVKASGLSMAQFGILMQLHFQQHCAVSDISNRMEITNAAASQLVDKLVQSGLLERTEDPQDRRAKQLKLATKGKELIEASLAERHRWIDSLVASLESADCEKVAEGMEILVRAMREMRLPEKEVR